MKYNSERGHKDQERAIIKYINKIMIRYPEQILIRLEKGCNEVLKKDADRFLMPYNNSCRRINPKSERI